MLSIHLLDGSLPHRPSTQQRSRLLERAPGCIVPGHKQQSPVSTRTTVAPQHSSNGTAPQHAVASPHLVKTVGFKVDALLARYVTLDSRLDGIERSMLDLTKRMSSEAPGTAGEATIGGAGTSNALLDINKIQSQFSEIMNSGYLESVKQLRETLLINEWGMAARSWAHRKAVSLFERHCVTMDVHEVTFEIISSLYEYPEDLSVLPTERLRMLMRSMMRETEAQMHNDVYNRCTDIARELAKTDLGGSLAKGAGGIGNMIRRLFGR